jgi:2-methylcitrate dehydratase PrpD
MPSPHGICRQIRERTGRCSFEDRMANHSLDRRSFLTLAALTASTWPRAAGSRQQSTMPRAATRETPSVMSAACAYVAGAGTRDLPIEVLTIAKHHVLDTFTAMLTGARFKVGRLAADFTRSQGGTPEAQVLGTSLLTSAINAALANGITAHADETDDSHEPSGTHPGCAIVPAALAIAEREGLGGLPFINAVVVGYDIGTRMNLALDRTLLGQSNHSTHAIGGVFGAAAASASLLRLTPDQTRWVFDYTGQQAAGVRYWVRDSEHIEKAFVYGGMPARNGVTASLLVGGGFTGIWDAFSGEANFFETFSTNPTPERFIDGLGRRFAVVATNIKKFSVGSPIQAPAEALHILIDRHKLRAQDVKALVVRMPSKRTVDNRDMPDINLQYILAVSLVDGGLTFPAAHSYERMTEGAVLDMKSRISVVEDPSLRTAATSRTGVVEVATRDDVQLREHVIHVRGTAENRMTTAEVEAKCRALLDPVLGADRAERLITTVRHLEKIRDMRELRPLLRAEG